MLTIEQLEAFVKRELERPYQPPTFILSPMAYDYLAENPEVAKRWYGRELPPRT
jgi:hypothetical protein